MQRRKCHDAQTDRPRKADKSTVTQAKIVRNNCFSRRALERGLSYPRTDTAQTDSADGHSADGEEGKRRGEDSLEAHSRSETEMCNGELWRLGNQVFLSTVSTHTSIE